MLRATSTYWPPPERRRKPSWTLQVQDDVVHRLLDEVYRALNDDLRTLAAMGVRALLDRTFELAGADAAAGFDEKLKSLTAEGVIGVRDKEALTIMTDAGSAASHRGWQPDADALDTILDAAEAVFYIVSWCCLEMPNSYSNRCLRSRRESQRSNDFPRPGSGSERRRPRTSSQVS